MKKLLLSFSLLVMMILPATAFEHVIDLKDEDPIGSLEKVISLHKTIYMTGQPDEKTLNSLKEAGFEVVLNIRGADDIKFDEKTMVEAQGLSYHNIPLLKEGAIQDAAVSDIHAVIKANKGKKILLHCSSGNQVAGWLGAFLVKGLSYEGEKAIALAKQAGMTKDSMEKMLQDYIVTISK